MKSIFLLLLLFVFIISTSLGWRSQTTSASSSSSSSNRTTKKDTTKEHFNIGLIAPHTNFGKREYSRAINSAILMLQKSRDTKLNFLKDYEFKAGNVHFDMISLTPSPTSE